MDRLKARRLARIAIYVILLASAGTTFLLGGRLWEAARVGDLPIWAPLIPATLFTAFVIVYSIDRWLLVRRKNYPLSRGIFQIAFAVVFLTLLWPSQATEFRQLNTPGEPLESVERLLAHAEDDVRAAACELLGYRGDIDKFALIHPIATDDPSPRVRNACSRAIERLQTAHINE